MSNSYAGIKCPVCEKKFSDTDDVVVCPECGTPHHRSCYETCGHCANEAMHGRQEEWSEEKSQADEELRYDSSATLRCSKCGTINPPQGIFCQICGCRLGEQGGAHSGSTAPDAKPIELNPFTTPYGGISPDEELDGVSVRDIALFVGENSHYFIPKFKAFFTGGRPYDWNWPSFLFRGFYFLYRKMYLPGIILVLLTVAINIPFAIVNYQAMLQTLASSQILGYNRLMMITNILSLLISLFCAIRVNKIYYKHVLSSIKRLRKIFGDDVYDQSYIMVLAKKGRTNRTLILVFSVVLLLMSMLASLFLIMFAA